MEAIVNKQKEFFNSNLTKPIEYRIDQLKKLKTALKAWEPALTKAIYQDFQKGAFNTYLTEFLGIYVDLDASIKNLRSWASTKRVENNMLNFPGKSYIIPEPLGVCLVIGAWNYPINLTITPVISAIAAGNTAILKPSEMTPNTSAAMAKMIAAYFDPAFLTVVEGGIEPTTELLAQKFDKIFFTGSPKVGRIVYQAAANNLTPVTLELGGKSPLVVAADANIKFCVKRLVWGKFLNAGQTCIAPDYAMVHKTIEQAFLEALKTEIHAAQYALVNQNYTQIINEKNLDRLLALIRPENIYTGGKYDRATRWLEPTVLTGIGPNDPVMEEEIFGPILPVLPYEDLDSAIAFIKSRPKPLSLYLFSESNAIRKKLFSEISFGGGAVNDVLFHFANPELPFGGVGFSGMGSYHGEAGFRTFSHYKSIVQKPSWLEFPIRYFPYSGWKSTFIKWVKNM
ncbi:MAG TPA: aldehyde dehydrogenase [Puia sp.]